MNTFRARAKEHFPMVLLTLLSIVQALALELLWSHVRSTDYLFAATFVALLSWVQIITLFLGLVLIWVVYASNTMRFRWVPSTSDSVYPFLIGVFEFLLIELLGPDDIGLWLIVMAVSFGTMVRVSHKTMQQARQDGDNDAFFSRYEPATLRDFAPQISVVSVLFGSGVVLLVTGHTGIFALIAILMTSAALVWQFRVGAFLWDQTVNQELPE